MNKTIFSFLGGAFLGSVIAWQVTERYYAAIAQKEIDDQKRWFENKCAECGLVNKAKDLAVKNEPVLEEEPFEDIRAQSRALNEAVGIIEREGYTQYSQRVHERLQNEEFSDKPYVISPDEYGEMEDYTQVQLTYYMDGIVADENDHPVNCPEDILGDEFWMHFGEYRDDSLHIRNDVKRCDYELLKALFTYSEAVGSLNAQVDSE